MNNSNFKYARLLDQKTGKNFKVIEAEAGQEVDLSSIFNSYPDEVFKTCVENIEIAISEKIDVIPIMVLKDIDFLIEIEKSDFEDCLDNAINHFISYENYEMCSIITGIKKSL